MLFDSPIPDMRVSLGVILPTDNVLAAVTSFLLSRVIKTHRMQPMTGVEGMVGKIGTVLADIDPIGKVLVNGEYWDARTSGAVIPAGASVLVVAVGDKQIDVKPAAEAGEGSS